MEFGFSWTFKFVRLVERFKPEARLAEMETQIRYRIDHDPVERARLLKYQGNLVAWNTEHDNYWGSCTCDAWPCGNGANWIGRILGKIKYELDEKTRFGKAGSE